MLFSSLLYWNSIESNQLNGTGLYLYSYTLYLSHTLKLMMLECIYQVPSNFICDTFTHGEPVSLKIFSAIAQPYFSVSADFDPFMFDGYL